MRLLAVVFVLGCGGEPSVSTAAPTACEQLDRGECLASQHCTMVKIEPHRYTCRREAGACEVGLSQTDVAGCEARPGCRFAPGSCYCSCRGAGRTAVEDKSGEACNCVCGGGAPGLCVPTSHLANGGP